MNLLGKILSFGQTPPNSRKRLSYTPIGHETKYYYDDLDMSIKVGDMVELNDLGRQYDHLVKEMPLLHSYKVSEIKKMPDYKYAGYRFITVENTEGTIHTFYNNVIKKSYAS